MFQCLELHRKSNSINVYHMSGALHLTINFFMCLQCAHHVCKLCCSCSCLLLDVLETKKFCQQVSINIQYSVNHVLGAVVSVQTKIFVCFHHK